LILNFQLSALLGRLERAKGERLSDIRVQQATATGADPASEEVVA